MKKWSLFLTTLCLLASLGCARQTLYVQSMDDNKEITPKVYFVNYDDGFMYALHAVELQSDWKLTYFDKGAGVIEALTQHQDTLTVRVASLDQSTTKVFAFVDAKSYSLDPKERFVSTLSQYYEQLNAHLKGWDANNL